MFIIRNRLLIKKVHAYGPKDMGIVDIAIDGEKITNIQREIPTDGDLVIDGTDKIIIPGVIETHAHMLLPFGGTQTMNDFYDGTLSGAYGGVTTLIDFADQKKGFSIYDALSNRIRQAENKCIVDYGFHLTLTDINKETLSAIPDLVNKGFTSFKFYTTYSNEGLYVSDRDLKKAFKVIARCNALATVHAETETMIMESTNRLLREGHTDISYFFKSNPNESEAAAIYRMVQIAKETGVRLLIRHISSKSGAEIVEQAQKEGFPVYGETCPHYLYFTREVYSGDKGSEYIVYPPIRGAKDKEYLWKLLQGNAELTIGTDDCAFYLEQKHISDKFYEIPGGMPGIETRLAVMYELGVMQRQIDIQRLACLISEIPAKLYGIYPQKGCIRVGSDADLVVINPRSEHVITANKLHEKSDYTPFEGLQVHMNIDEVISRGRRIFVDEKCTVEAGSGRLIHRTC